MRKDDYTYIPISDLVKRNDLRVRSHESTDKLITGILDILDGISGDLGGISISEFEILEPEFLADLKTPLTELFYILQELTNFLNSGSRQKLLRHFREEDLEKQGYFTDIIDEISSSVGLISSLLSSIEVDRRLSPQLVYDAVNRFRAVLYIIARKSISDTSILHEFIMDDGEEEYSNLEYELQILSWELNELNQLIFRWMFIQGDPEMALGLPLLSVFRQYIPELKERLGRLQSLMETDLTNLKINEEKREKVKEKILDHISVIEEYIQSLSDSSKTNEQVQSARQDSDLKWMNNSLGPLALLIVKLIEEENWGF